MHKTVTLTLVEVLLVEHQSSSYQATKFKNYIDNWTFYKKLITR